MKLGMILWNVLPLEEINDFGHQQIPPGKISFKLTQLVRTKQDPLNRTPKLSYRHSNSAYFSATQ